VVHRKEAAAEHGASGDQTSAPAKTGNEKGGDGRGPAAHGDAKH
jgi:hypothetical protein